MRRVGSPFPSRQQAADLDDRRPARSQRTPVTDIEDLRIARCPSPLAQA